jgi:hypothetical protein
MTELEQQEFWALLNRPLQTVVLARDMKSEGLNPPIYCGLSKGIARLKDKRDLKKTLDNTPSVALD